MSLVTLTVPLLPLNRRPVQPRGLRASLLAVWLAAAPLAGCGNDSTTPSSTTSTTASTTTEVYTGGIGRGESGFYSFTALASGTTTVTFASLVDGATGRPVDLTMGLGIGVPLAEGCNLSSTATASPGLSAQLSSTVNAGVYCVQMSDIGNLKSTATFAVRIVHP